MHTYIHEYIHACMHIYTHAYIHTHMHTYIHTCMHTYTQTYTHTDIHIYIHTHKRTYIHIYMHAYIHTCIPTYMHTCMHTCMRTYIHTYIHIYRQTDRQRLTCKLCRQCVLSASVIGSLQDPTCAECEKNNGVCYTLTTKKREGCKCIISQTGQNCETKLGKLQNYHFALVPGTKCFLSLSFFHMEFKMLHIYSVRPLYCNFFSARSSTVIYYYTTRAF